MINTIILIAKQYIYSAKCLQEKISFQALVCKINRYKNSKYLSAKKNKRTKEHENKWMLYDKV